VAKLEKTESAEVAKPKRRISWFAWLVTLCVACCLVVMNLRGELNQDSIEYVLDSKTAKLKTTFSHEHGWPIRWLESQPNDTHSGMALPKRFSGKLRVLAEKPSLEQGWLPNASSVSVEYRALSINVLVLMCILLTVFFACRFRTRRQRGFKFSLLEVAMTMLLVSVAMANYQYHRGISEKENRLIGESEGNIKALEHKYHGASFLRLLVGDAKWISVYRHVDQFEYEAMMLDASIDRRLGDFAFARSVKIKSDPTLKQIEALAQIHSLKSIEVEGTRGVFDLLDLPQRVGASNRSKDKLLQKYAGSDMGESPKVRVQQPNATFPSVTELSINSDRASDNRWPRALDFVSRCPKLEKISLIGKQFLVEDLIDLPPSIEEIKFGVRAPEDGVEILRREYPDAIIESTEIDDRFYNPRNRAWDIAEILVNRRRSLGWDGSQFTRGQLDLSSTYVDQEFLQELNSVFPNTNSIIFGSFDSRETAIWLTQQCPKLGFVKTNGFPFEYSDAMQLPKSLTWLVIEQGAISADEFVELIQHLELSNLQIISSSFEDHEIEKIRAANRDCRLVLR